MPCGFPFYSPMEVDDPAPYPDVVRFTRTTSPSPNPTLSVRMPCTSSPRVRPLPADLPPPPRRLPLVSDSAGRPIPAALGSATTEDLTRAVSPFLEPRSSGIEADRSVHLQVDADSHESHEAPRRSTRGRKVRVRREVQTLTERAAAESETVLPPPVVPSRDAMPDLSRAEPGSESVDLDPRDDDAVGHGVATSIDSEESNLPTSPILLSYEDIKLPTPQRAPQDVYASSHSNPLVRLSLLTTAQLHIKYNLGFYACSVLLLVFAFIFFSVDVIAAKSEMPTTLQTVLQHFDLHDRFEVYPLCVDCHQPYLSSSPPDSRCLECDTALFHPTTTKLFNDFLHLRGNRRSRAVVAAPIRTLSALLVDFLNEPGMEAACEDWKTRENNPGTYSSIMDGAFWNELWGVDTEPFFDRHNDQDGDLRLGVTFSLDWSISKICLYFFLFIDSLS